jgi:hypothetical protein
MVSFYSYIVKFILALRLGFSKPQMNHLISFVHGIILCDGRVNVSQIRRSSNEYRDLSCLTRFLNESPWNPDHMNQQRMKFMMEHIQKVRSSKGDTRPITFLIIDDTQCPKDTSTQHMEGLEFHFSHSDGKSVWSHSLVSAHVVSGSFSFAWDFRPYFREPYCVEHGLDFKSKNELARELIQSYRTGDEQVYVLVDSWYTNKELLDLCNQRGFHVIGAFRSNRKLYPKGIGIKVSEFASQYVKSSDLHSVTVEDHTYKVYPYEGKLSDIENVKVLISWEDDFDSNEAPFCILCTDSSLDLVTIQSYYDVRWSIETGYRFFKELLGFDEYELHSFKAIKRFWCIQFLVYNYLEFQRNMWATECSLTIGDVVRRIRKEHFGQLIVYVYQQALEKKPITEVLQTFKISA